MGASVLGSVLEVSVRDGQQQPRSRVMKGSARGTVVDILGVFQ